MKDIILLTDYKGHFGSKYIASPYRSGMDKELLSRCFSEHNYRAEFLPFTDVNFRNKDYRDRVILYTSAEDWDGHYKSYIEDIILGLSLTGAELIPGYPFLHAHNNKVFMEILRDVFATGDEGAIPYSHYGTLEALKRQLDKFTGKYVVKPAAGCMSRGIRQSDDPAGLLKNAARTSRSPRLKKELIDIGRKWKHSGYVRESGHRKKFLVQQLVPGLDDDWKVLVYWDKYFVLHRKTRDKDFRASGSGKLAYTKDIPAGLLDYCEKIFRLFDVPNISLDIGYDGSGFFLFEFQALYYGTYTIDFSEYYFAKKYNAWTAVDTRSLLEEEFVYSIVRFLENNNE
jgi:hypothetical protein